MSRGLTRVVTLALVASSAAGCGTGSVPDAVATTVMSVTTSTAPATTTSTSTTTTTSTSTTTQPPTTTTTLAPTLADMATLDDIDVDRPLEIGRSVLGEPLEVIRRGDPNGARVLVVGVIHGDESAGLAIIDELEQADVPDGVELWLVPTMNPDGERAVRRHNTNGVDLNRNFPHNWEPLAQPGDWQYGGPSAASEPETQAVVALGERIQPHLVLWYHQDLNRINPAWGFSGEVRNRYAELTGLPIVAVTGGTYTGTASQWSRTVLAEPGTGFTVELGPTLTPDQARAHADAVIAVTAEIISPRVVPEPDGALTEDG